MSCEFYEKRARERMCFYNPVNLKQDSRKFPKTFLHPVLSVPHTILLVHPRCSPNTKKTGLICMSLFKHKATAWPRKNLSNLNLLDNGSSTSGTHEGDVITPFENVNPLLTGCICVPGLGKKLIGGGIHSV